MLQIWAGVDAGKTHHHCVVVDAQGHRLYSRRVANDEADLLDLVADVVGLAGGGGAVWATDLNHGGAALLIALLEASGQTLLYIPGRTVHHASKTYRGDGKTDARDAAVIADQARMRPDLQPLRTGDPVSVDLRILTARRADKAVDRVRAINRLRAQLLEYFPALERFFDYSRSRAAMLLLTKYSTPDGLRRAGEAGVRAWLKDQGARSSALVAKRALAAAMAQRTGEAMVAALAGEVLDLERELGELEESIAGRVVDHRHAAPLLSMPG